MAHTNYSFTAGDTGAKMRVRMIDARTGQILVPFNGTYNAFLWVKPAGLASVKRVMTVLSGADDGYAEYTFLSSELLLGTLQTQVEIVRVSDGGIVSELGIKEHTVGPKLST